MGAAMCNARWRPGRVTFFCWCFINNNNDVGEHYRKAIATCHDFMRFNGLDFVLGSSNLYKCERFGTTSHVTVQRRRTLHLCSTKHSAFLQALCVAILVCGDVELNPGPNYKFPCGDCCKPVKSNQMGLLCATCQSWFHIKCEGMSSIEYARLYALPDEPWFCGTCSLPQFSDSFFESTISSTNTDETIESTLSSEHSSMIDRGSHSNILCCLFKL